MPTPDIEPPLTTVQLLRVVQQERFVQRLADSVPRDRRPDAGNAMSIPPRRPSDPSGGAAAAVDVED